LSIWPDSHNSQVVVTGHSRYDSLLQSGMKSKIALSSVVTAGVLQEFLLLKFSFELFHGTDHLWYIRCDRGSEAALSLYPDLLCTVFREEGSIDRIYVESNTFRFVAAEKMNSVEDAWKGGDYDAVVHLDADLIMTSPALSTAVQLGGQVVLSPHYFPPSIAFTDRTNSGHYNGGFVFTRSPQFHEWWRCAFASRKDRYADQTCLEYAERRFDVRKLSNTANIGSWRRKSNAEYYQIPPDCLFLHAHFFQPLRTPRDWFEKSFALHCLKFLKSSCVKEHQILLREILVRDTSGWYEASLKLSHS
jgi:hypothetical protein